MSRSKRGGSNFVQCSQPGFKALTCRCLADRPVPRGAADAEPPLGIKRVLIDSALVFRGARSPRLVIAGELLRRSLAGETMSRLPSIVVEPNPNEKSRRGIV